MCNLTTGMQSFLFFIFIFFLVGLNVTLTHSATISSDWFCASSLYGAGDGIWIGMVFEFCD